MMNEASKSSRRALGTLTSVLAAVLLSHCGDSSRGAVAEGGSGTHEGGAQGGIAGGGDGGDSASGEPAGSSDAGAAASDAGEARVGPALDASGDATSPDADAGKEVETGGDAGGDAGPASVLRADFMLGADISSVQEAVDLGAVFIDTDGQEKSMVALLAAHGFNVIRLRTFVEPMNLYGYANPNGDPAYLRAQAYCDRDHTAAFGKELKDAGMKFLLDLHYSDNWADPGKQIIPQSWRDVTSLDDLGQRVEVYSRDLVQYLVDAGAAPDIVQVGNEITPGMLIHVPADPADADQWGNLSKVTNAISGAATNWTNLATLLKRAIAGVRAAHPSVRIMLHIENTNSASGVLHWVTMIRSQGVEFDILGLSCYTAWQGSPSVWESTFQSAARTFPELKFIIAEYGPEGRRAAEIMRDLPDRRGLGTFYWEPTESGSWGPSLFSRQGTTYTAIEPAFGVFDGIRADFGIPTPSAGP